MGSPFQWFRLVFWSIPTRLRLPLLLAVGVLLLVVWMNTAAPAGRELAAANRSMQTATAAAQDGRYPLGTPAPNGVR